MSTTLKSVVVDNNTYYVDIRRDGCRIYDATQTHELGRTRNYVDALILCEELSRTDGDTRSCRSCVHCHVSKVGLANRHHCRICDELLMSLKPCAMWEDGEVMD